MNINREFHRHLFNLRMIPTRYRQAKLLRSLQKRDRIKDVFFAANLSMWKYQSLYEALSQHDCFDLYIVLSPFHHLSRDQQEQDVNQLRDFFQAKGIPFIDYNLKGMVQYDVRENINPDILFYSQPKAKLYHPLHNASNFEDKLFCYYPYAFWTGTIPWTYNTRLQNLAWKLFYSTELHRQEAVRHSFRKDLNVEVVGYPDADLFMNYQPTDKVVWKKQDRPKKRLVWAPHCAIPSHHRKNVATVSNFLWMADLMLSIADKYKDVLQIAFKPHPFLISRLYGHTGWGKERTNAYYQQWAEGENTQLEQTGFVDLFMTSDAMIHDCFSFLVEYHYTQKPVMYVQSHDHEHVDQLNALGKQALAVHYQGKDEAALIDFIERVVLAGEDPMRPQRKQFYQENLIPPMGKSVTQATVEIIMKGLKKFE